MDNLESNNRVREATQQPPAIDPLIGTPSIQGRSESGATTSTASSDACLPCGSVKPEGSKLTKEPSTKGAEN